MSSPVQPVAAVTLPSPEIITAPDATAAPLPPREPLSAEHQTKLDQLIARFNAPDFTLPTTLDALKSSLRRGTGGSARSIVSFLRASVGGQEDEVEEDKKDWVGLDERERCYWSREGFARVLRSVKWDYTLAVRRAEETCVWRREARVEDITFDDIEEEARTGKELVLGFDLNCRPVLYMHPDRQNTTQSPRQIDFVVWCLERTIDLCPPSDPAIEMLCLLIDFGASRGSKAPPTSIGQAKKVLKILQTYYCERLGRAVCVDVPTIFYTFYTIIGPFIDPATKDKIRFLPSPDATGLVPPSQLQSLFGGSIDFQYDHATYFPALAKICDERKAANLARWRKFGNNLCGLSEVIIRGANEVEAPTAAAPGGHKSSTTIAVQDSVPQDSAIAKALDGARDDPEVTAVEGALARVELEVV